MPDNLKGISLPPESSHTLLEGKQYLLLIAVDAYQHFTPLNNCVRDAEALRAVLTQKYGYEIFKTPLYNADVTSANVTDWLGEAANVLKPEDSLLIFFSGHGANLKNKGAWLMADAQIDKNSTYFTSNNLQLALNDLAHLRHILVIVDCCFPDRIVNSDVIGFSDSGAGIKSRWAMASGKNTPVSDGMPGEHSPFITFFLEELKMQHKILKIKTLDIILDKKAGARCVPLQGDEGGDFTFIPIDFNPDLPDPLALRDAFFDLRLGNCELDFNDNFNFEQHFFNLFIIQSKNEQAGHLLLAKKLIRSIVKKNGSPHFDAVKFEFGNIAMPIQKPWDALSNALNMADSDPQLLTKLLAEKIKTKNLILFIEIKNSYDEQLILDFWHELNQHLKDLPEQAYSTKNTFKLFLFLLDKRKSALDFGAFPASLNYSIGLQLSDIEQLPINRLSNWKAALAEKEDVFKPTFENIDFTHFAPESLFAENFVLEVCRKCTLDQSADKSPYRYIFEQYQTL